MRRKFLTGFAVAALAMGAAVQPAEAQFEVETSMNVAFSGSNIIFYLSPASGSYTLTDLQIYLNPAGSTTASNFFAWAGDSGYRFDTSAPVSVEGATSGDVSASYNAEATTLTFAFATFNETGPLADTPVKITAGLSTVGNDFTQIAYLGDFDGGLSIGGTVTPEPSTIILLGTGLVGVFVVGRRRRNGEVLEA